MATTPPEYDDLPPEPIGGKIVGVIVGIACAAFVIHHAAGHEWGSSILGDIWAAITTMFFAVIALIITSIAWGAWPGAGRRDAEIRRREAVDTAREQLLEASTLLATAHAAVPPIVSDAATHLESAQAHFTAHAYSPFWEQVEAFYRVLARHGTAMKTLEDRARAYADAQATLSSKLDDEQAPTIPLNVTDMQALRVTDGLAQRMNELVYAAQRDGTFAQIWEQRRTTAATIAGFANLEAAVNRMSATLSQQLAELQNTLITVGAQVTDAIHTSSAAQVQAVQSLQGEVRTNTMVAWMSQHHASTEQLQGFTAVESQIAASTAALQNTGVRINSGPRPWI